MDKQAQGKWTPLENKPEQDKETNIYLECYFGLSHFRQSSMSGVGSIGLKDIIDFHTFINQYGSIQEFIRIMIALDIVFIKHHTKEAPKK